MTVGLLGVHGFGGMESFAQVASGALVAAVWQGIAIAAAVGLGLRLLPKMPAAVRFATWASAFGVIVLLPFLHDLVGNRSTDAVNAMGAHTPAVWTLDARWSLSLVAVWAAMSVGRGISLVVGAVKLHGLWKRATPVEVEVPATVRRVQVCTSDEVDRPGVIGFFAPKIVIPTWLFEKLTSPEIEQIVLHETGHLRRADDWINLLQKLALAVFPLNPALLWVERKLCFERELACDDAVLSTTRSPKEYATCLTTIAEHRMGRRAQARRGIAKPLGALSLGALGRQSELGRRVESILRRGDRMSFGQARFAMAVAVAGLLVGTAELSRCRELVSFSGVAPVGMAQGATSHMGVDSLYQPAGFRPSQGAHETLLKATMPTKTVPDAQSARAKRVLTADTSTIPQARFMGAIPIKNVVAKSRDAGGSSQPGSPEAGQWLVVTTTWRGPDGSRMVLTTAELPMPMSSDMPETAAPVGSPAHVYPYAAVPTRDGWLVFQL